MSDSVGRAAWRIWVPPLAVTMIMMATLSYPGADGVWNKPDGTQLILILHGSLALLFRLRYPLAVTIVTIAAGAALPLTAHHLVLVNVASVVALYTLANLRSRRTAMLAGVAAAVAMTASIAPWQPGGVIDLANLLPINYIAAAVAAGDATRSRRALLAEIRDRAAADTRRQVQEERIRIARDLHDVVAHHITLVNAQAGVAHHLMRTHPDQATAALAGIRDTSRTALDELRATVGLLRQDDDPPSSRSPAPAFDDLDGLIDGFTRSGFTVEVSRHGTPAPLTGPAGLAAYRIVQEALTNAGKHGTARRADLDLSYSAGTLRISVINAARAGHQGQGTGHGLIGMRERADAAGGTLTTGMRPDGFYAVRADLPLRDVSAGPS
ncbi:signal transduction histidine kinase [Actinoplanes lutulentus]|uniref:histidine kinase n=1 Tax=Actinoplanes lutulentus TaxID=1287878 RepID=A0A327Z4U1_9ACTN|nr:histidine kinase [Actinoplanes lutulentus]MBB2948860.1 signal transduction histidine kinase [Actinoplanes lutulentus]RAK29770.1 signal transduction histidine kinase [Actinoplanes lutulentus]